MRINSEYRTESFNKKIGDQMKIDKIKLLEQLEKMLAMQGVDHHNGYTFIYTRGYILII